MLAQKGEFPEVRTALKGFRVAVEERVSKRTMDRVRKDYKGDFCDAGGTRAAKSHIWFLDGFEEKDQEKENKRRVNEHHAW